MKSASQSTPLRNVCLHLEIIESPEQTLIHFWLGEGGGGGGGEGGGRYSPWPSVLPVFFFFLYSSFSSSSSSRFGLRIRAVSCLACMLSLVFKLLSVCRYSFLPNPSSVCLSLLSISVSVSVCLSLTLSLSLFICPSHTPHSFSARCSHANTPHFF